MLGKGGQVRDEPVSHWQTGRLPQLGDRRERGIMRWQQRRFRFSLVTGDNELIPLPKS